MKQKIHYGDIYLVDFEPSRGHGYKKQRPAVVIQSDGQLRKSNFVTVMPMTSRLDKRHTDDIIVPKDGSNRLWTDSLIKVHAILSFDIRRFIKKIGTMDDMVMKKIKEYLHVHFGL